MKLPIDCFNPKKIPNYTDWRLKSNRREAITKVAHHRILMGDLDHGHSGRVICDELNLTNEQRAWFAFLFGHSYRTYWAGLFIQKFPDIDNTDPMEIDRWLKKKTPFSKNGKQVFNYNRVIYGNDTKWNRGTGKDGRQKLTISICETKKLCGNRTLYETLKTICSVSSDKNINKDNLDDAFEKIPYIGWMCGWLWAQMLFDLFFWNIDKWRLPFPDNWSSFNSVCYIYDKIDYMCTKTHTPSKEQVNEIHEDFLDLINYMNDALPVYIDAYNLESVLCEYRKTAFGPRIKEFTHWNISEQNLLYIATKMSWRDEINSGLSFKPMLIGQMTKNKFWRGVGYSKDYFRIVHETGMLQNVDVTYPELPNVYDYLDVPHPDTIKLPEMIDEWNEFPENVQLNFYKKYDPVNFIKEKK